MNDAEEKLGLIYSALTDAFVLWTFRRSSPGFWTREKTLDGLSVAIATYRIPFPSKKRITFSLNLLIGSALIERIVHPWTQSEHSDRYKLKRHHAPIQKTLCAASQQRVFTVFPSTDESAVSDEICSLISKEWAPQLEQTTSYDGLITLLRAGWITTGYARQDAAIIESIKAP